MQVSTNNSALASEQVLQTGHQQVPFEARHGSWAGIDNWGASGYSHVVLPALTLSAVTAGWAAVASFLAGCWSSRVAGVVVGTDVTKSANTTPQNRRTGLGLVAVWMVDHLFVRMGEFTAETVGTFVDNIAVGANMLVWNLRY